MTCDHSLQAPANGCHCKPLLNRLEGQLEFTQEEMRLHILNIQEEVNCRLDKMVSILSAYYNTFSLRLTAQLILEV